MTASFGATPQVGEFLVSELIDAFSNSPDTTELLESIDQGVEAILQNLQGLEAETLMLSLTGLLQTAMDNLNTLLLQPSGGPDVNEPLFFSDAQNAAYILQDSAYWIRPYRDDLTFGGATLDEYLPSNGRPSTVSYDGAVFVYDPQLSAPAFAQAIGVFLSMAAIFHQSDPQTLQPYATDLATFLSNNYTTMVQGLVMVPIPSQQTLLSLAASSGPGPGQYPYTDGQSLPILPLNYTPWHGELGAYDVYSVFGSQTPGFPNYGVGYLPPTNAFGTFLPTTNAGCVIDFYPALGTLMVQVLESGGHGLDQISYMYPWFYMRMRLGNLTRFKALYLAKSYDQLWTLVQKLRVISAGQPGTPVYGLPPAPAPLVSDLNAHWSVTAISNLFAELPVSYMQWPGSGVGGPVTVEQVIQRLLGTVDNFTTNPTEEPPVLAATHPRPLSLRTAIAAVAI